jgi:hypothetical protein
MICLGQMRRWALRSQTPGYERMARLVDCGMAVRTARRQMPPSLLTQERRRLSQFVRCALPDLEKRAADRSQLWTAGENARVY